MSGRPGTLRAALIVRTDVGSPDIDRAADHPAAARQDIAVRALVGVLRGYQRFVSPLIPPSCRFTPSCSEYAVQALRTHGVLYGAWLTVRRLLRCAPWHPGGWDPVPPARPTQHRTADTPAEEND